MAGGEFGVLPHEDMPAATGKQSGINHTRLGLQVVVDSDATGKALLSNGQLANRVTIIPLNKVCASLQILPSPVCSPAVIFLSGEVLPRYCLCLNTADHTADCTMCLVVPA